MKIKILVRTQDLQPLLDSPLNEDRRSVDRDNEPKPEVDPEADEDDG